jgi:hypothetical protein
MRDWGLSLRMPSPQTLAGATAFGHPPAAVRHLGAAPSPVSASYGADSFVAPAPPPLPPVPLPPPPPPLPPPPPPPLPRPHNPMVRQSPPVVAPKPFKWPAPSPQAAVTAPPPAPPPSPSSRSSADATVKAGTVRIRFWDEQEEDGDYIRIMLNGRVVPGLESVRLTNRGTVANLPLQPGKNVITIVALSTGVRGPCTSGIQILDNVVVAGKAQSRTDDLEVGQSSRLELDRLL